MLFTLLVVASIIGLLIWDRMPPDIVLFGGLALLMLGHVITPAQAFAGFADPATATVAVLLVVAEAVRETGGMRYLARFAFGAVRGPRWALLRFTGIVTMLSAVLNNTPLVAMFLPAVDDYARRMRESPSRFLMPMSFAAMLGGTCTLIGTSTNLVVSGLMSQAGLEPMGMFELSWVGVPTAIVGVAYMVLMGPRLLRPRVDPMEALHTQTREYLAEVELMRDSPLVNTTVERSGLRQLPGLYLVEIRRLSGVIVQPVGPEDELLAGDHLVFSGGHAVVKELRTIPGVLPVEDVRLDDALERNLYEVVISHRSSLVGRTIAEAEFRRHYEAGVLAVHRGGERIGRNLGEVRLRAGDTLMLTAARGFENAFRNGDDFYLVTTLDDLGAPRYRRSKRTLMVLLVMVLLPEVLGISMLESAMAGFLALILMGCLSFQGVHRALNLTVILSIGSAFGLSKALEVSGAAAQLGHALDWVARGHGPLVVMAAVYVFTAVCTNVMTNAAAAALVFPVVLTVCQANGLEPRGFAMAMAMAASAAFSTPVGYQTNLMVYGPGGYRTTDFLRFGLPLNVLTMIVALLVIPRIWPW